MVARWTESKRHSLPVGIGRLRSATEDTRIRHPEPTREVFLAVVLLAASFLGSTGLRNSKGLQIAPVHWGPRCLHPHHAVPRHLPRCRTWWLKGSYWILPKGRFPSQRTEGDSRSTRGPRVSVPSYTLEGTTLAPLPLWIRSMHRVLIELRIKMSMISLSRHASTDAL